VYLIRIMAAGVFSEQHKFKSPPFGEEMHISKQPKRFAVYRISDHERYVLEGVYATAEEAMAHKWRLDCRYTIHVDGKHMSREQFTEWVRSGGVR
jgi:hypothetical protein